MRTDLSWVRVSAGKKQRGRETQAGPHGMACCMDPESRAALRVSKDIDREIERLKRESSKEYKLLLFGTDEAGKSTFIEQMRIIYGQVHYSDKDRKEFIPLIFRNILMAVQILSEAMATLKIPYKDDNNRIIGNKFLEMNIYGVTSLEPDSQNSIRKFWADSGIQSCFERRREFQIFDSAKYYLDDLDRIFNSDYIPDLYDILCIQKPSAGIIEYTFQMRKYVVFRLIDIGGLRCDKRMQIISRVCEGMKVVIFLTAINDYDQVLLEDVNDNKLNESLKHFKSILCDPWFREATFILIFNKTDLFEEKIMKSHLSDYFPQYSGPPRDAEEAKDFIKDMFLSVIPDENIHIFHHFLTATDTESMQRFFEAIKTTVLEECLRYYDLIV